MRTADPLEIDAARLLRRDLVSTVGAGHEQGCLYLFEVDLSARGHRYDFMLIRPQKANRRREQDLDGDWIVMRPLEG